MATKIDRLVRDIERVTSDLEDIKDQLDELAGEVGRGRSAGILKALESGKPSVVAEFGHSSDECIAVDEMIEKLKK